MRFRINVVNFKSYIKVTKVTKITQNTFYEHLQGSLWLSYVSLQWTSLLLSSSFLGNWLIIQLFDFLQIA